MQELLEPLVVIVVQRANENLSYVLQAVQKQAQMIVGVAVPTEAAELPALRTQWEMEQDAPLLIFHPDGSPALEKALEAIESLRERRSHQPLVVVYSNHEKDASFLEFREELASRISERCLDVQQLEYSPTWRKSPPRLR